MHAVTAVSGTVSFDVRVPVWALVRVVKTVPVERQFRATPGNHTTALIVQYGLEQARHIVEFAHRAAK